jgi:hypothetical protein
MARKKTSPARLRLVPAPHQAARLHIAAFRTVERPVSIPFSSAVSDVDVERARELARTLGWNEVIAS